MLRRVRFEARRIGLVLLLLAIFVPVVALFALIGAVGAVIFMSRDLRDAIVKGRTQWTS